MKEKKTMKNNPIPRPERPPSPSVITKLEIDLREKERESTRRNQLLLQLQDEVMKLSNENQTLRMKSHKLKQHNAWMKERLKYTGNIGKIKMENDVDIVLRENASLKAQVYDLKEEMYIYKQKEKHRITLKDQTIMIRNNRNYIMKEIQTKLDLLNMKKNGLVKEKKEKQARMDALNQVMGFSYQRSQQMKQFDMRKLRKVEKEMKLFLDIQSFLNLVLDSYHSLILHQEKVKRKLNDESKIKTGKINSLTRLAHIRKHGVLMGFQESLEANELSQSYNKYNEKGNVMLPTSKSATSLDMLKMELAEDSIETSPAAWKRCYKCKMYNSVKAIECAHCKSEYLELISIPPKKK